MTRESHAIFDIAWLFCYEKILKIRRTQMKKLSLFHITLCFIILLTTQTACLSVKADESISAVKSEIKLEETGTIAEEESKKNESILTESPQPGHLPEPTAPSDVTLENENQEEKAESNTALSSSTISNSISELDTYYAIYSNSSKVNIQETQAGTEQINPKDGSLNYSCTDVKLKGNAGFDFELTRQFATNRSADSSNRLCYYYASYSENMLIPYAAVVSLGDNGWYYEFSAFFQKPNKSISERTFYDAETKIMLDFYYGRLIDDKGSPNQQYTVTSSGGTISPFGFSVSYAYLVTRYDGVRFLF